MVRPASFGYNPETAPSNAFQHAAVSQTAANIQESALTEFDGLAATLIDYGVRLTVLEDTAHPVKHDAVFPNNWLSTHEDGTVILYPMFSEMRRQERRQDILDELEQYYEIRKVVDLSHYEAEGRFLEGTGSIVFDRINGVAFACRSSRTDPGLLDEVAAQLGYEAMLFDSVDVSRKPVYHTNVMLSVGTQFTVLAESTMPDADQRDRLIAALEAEGRRIVKLRPGQLEQFGGNILEIQGRDRLVAMSTTAFHSISAAQRDLLEVFAQLIHAPIPTIERVGGGSVRCMMCEIFLPRK
ncbi:MAG: arginine deiminase-related protein [Bacteroidota bacterium]